MAPRIPDERIKSRIQMLLHNGVNPSGSHWIQNNQVIPEISQSPHSLYETARGRKFFGHGNWRTFVETEFNVEYGRRNVRLSDEKLHRMITQVIQSGHSLKLEDWTSNRVQDAVTNLSPFHLANRAARRGYFGHGNWYTYLEQRHGIVPVDFPAFAAKAGKRAYGLDKMKASQILQLTQIIASQVVIAPKTKPRRTLSDLEETILTEMAENRRTRGFIPASELAEKYKSKGLTVKKIGTLRDLANRRGLLKPQWSRPSRAKPKLREVDETHPLVQQNRTLMEILIGQSIRKNPDIAASVIRSAGLKGLIRAAEIHSGKDETFAAYARSFIKGHIRQEVRHERGPKQIEMAESGQIDPEFQKFENREMVEQWIEQQNHPRGSFNIFIEPKQVGAFDGRVELRVKDRYARQTHPARMEVNGSTLGLTGKTPGDQTPKKLPNEEARASHLILRTILPRMQLPSNLSSSVRLRFKRVMDLLNERNSLHLPETE